MAVKLILHGKVQGVYCRKYCQENAQKLNIKGSASNMPDNTVKVILDTNDEKIIDEFIRHLKENPFKFSFYGNITKIDINKNENFIKGDYNF
ncbi:MAG: acylphosphatase [Spirochaetia bacterium]|nr:acylphosphatase [Spirochaetia bacterium]